MNQDDLFGASPRPADTVHRLFFALWPEEALRRSIATVAADLHRSHGGDGRLLNPQRYHLTLQFLGDFEALPERLKAQACAAANTVRAPAFELLLDRAGSFRNRAVPWWLGSERRSDGLDTLWRELGMALARQGVRVASGSRELVPHLTIVRDARRELPPTPIAPLGWRVDRFVLIHSELGRATRNAYTVLGEWRLAG